MGRCLPEGGDSNAWIKKWIGLVYAQYVVFITLDGGPCWAGSESHRLSRGQIAQDRDVPECFDLDERHPMPGVVGERPGVDEPRRVRVADEEAPPLRPGRPGVL